MAEIRTRFDGSGFKSRTRKEFDALRTRRWGSPSATSAPRYKSKRLPGNRRSLPSKQRDTRRSRRCDWCRKASGKFESLATSGNSKFGQDSSSRPPAALGMKWANPNRSRAEGWRRWTDTDQIKLYHRWSILCLRELYHSSHTQLLCSARG